MDPAARRIVTPVKSVSVGLAQVRVAESREIAETTTKGHRSGRGYVDGREDPRAGDDRPLVALRSTNRRNRHEPALVGT